ncbi:MAG: tetratricopeptide repeat protein [Cytophagales bacterium]|nr:tetratricopeptide repeat protein [Cytophagales bacterium]
MTMKQRTILTALVFALNFAAYLPADLSRAEGREALAQAGSQPKTDSLIAALKTATHGTTKINLLNDIAWQLKYSHPDSALTYARKALSIITVIASGEKGSFDMKGWLQKSKAKVLSTIGALYYLKGNYPKAIDHYQRSLKIAEATTDKKGEARSLNNLGLVYYSQGDYPKAIDHHQRSLKIAEVIGDKNGEAHSLNNLGNVFADQGDYPKAIDHYQRSLKIKEALGDKNGEARSLMNLGNVYYRQGDYPKAIDHHQRSLKIAEATADKNGEARSLNNLGNVYYRQGDYPKAIDHYQHALKIKEAIGDKEGEASSLTNLGILYSETGNTTAATEYCLKSLAIAREIGALFVEMETCQCLSEAYEKRSHPKSTAPLNPPKGGTIPSLLPAPFPLGSVVGKSPLWGDLGGLVGGDLSPLEAMRKALEYHKLWAIAKDSLFNKEKTKEITRLVTRYEMEKRWALEKRAEEEKVKAEAEKKARSSLVQLSVIGLVLGLVLIAILFSGRFAIPVAAAKVVVFVFIVFLFEFILVLLDPFIAKISGGNPAIQLLCNGAVALLVFPLFNFLLNRLTQKVAKVGVARRKVKRKEGNKGIG